MSSENALVSLDGVGKSYPLASSSKRRLRLLLSMLSRGVEYEYYRALSGIDLTLRRGESLGVVGTNGAGKSTLLKIVAGVVKPSSGRVRVQGRIGALLELGAGFHPEYTGRENIHLAAALMGIGRKALLGRIDSIIEFADIGEHIDQPIKHYSSGMVVRLGFAVATAIRPDVLITDEVLSVGDESFQKKCIRWMEAYLSGGGTLLLCSHSMYHIQKLCQKAIWIHEGEARMYGASEDVTREYLAFHEEKERIAKAGAAGLEKAMSAGVYSITDIWLESGGKRSSVVEMGSAIDAYGLVYSPDGRTPVVAIGIVRADGTPIYGLPCDLEHFEPNALGENLFGFCFGLTDISLLPGRYIVRAHAMDPEAMRLFDTSEVAFDVVGVSRELGFCRLGHEWKPGKMMSAS